MAKIIQVLNSIISNQDKISSVIRSNSGGNSSEFFFLYDNKYKWSIVQNSEGNYYVHLYPTTDESLAFLASLDGNSWKSVVFVTYSTEDLKTPEAIETFRELYQIVSDKLFGVEEIFNAIIAGG
jgi:hypothetical protein